MRTQVLHCLIKHALMIGDDISDRTLPLKEATIRLLCVLCTVKTNRFYIPGETHIVERLRKESFDKGIFATLLTVHDTLAQVKYA